MICMRSRTIRPSASRQCRDGGGERSVGVTDRLRHARRARAEHQHAQSDSGAGGFERPARPARSARRGAASASTRRAPDGRRRRATGVVSASACSTSARFHAGLISTTPTPSRQMACSATTNSGRFDDISATRDRRPSRHARSSTAAMPLASASSCGGCTPAPRRRAARSAHSHRCPHWPSGRCHTLTMVR